jgi:hypothetical protein
MTEDEFRGDLILLEAKLQLHMDRCVALLNGPWLIAGRDNSKNIKEMLTLITDTAAKLESCRIKLEKAND